MKKILLLFCITLHFLPSAGQQVGNQNVIPPSPTAASLAKFSEIPIGHYTGTAAISIPIYTVVDGELSLPVNLSYNTSGIKVNEDASWVGLGWTLNAGGVITRVVRGLDDFSGVGYPRSPELPVATANNLIDINQANYQQLQNLSLLNNEDPEPDLFYYNFGSYSGKFILEKCTDCNQLPYKGIILGNDNLKITYDNIKWTIKDPEGIVYTFETAENTTPRSQEFSFDPPDDYPDVTPTGVTLTNSWYLDEMVSANGNDRISLYYKRGNGSALFASLSTYRKSHNVNQLNNINFNGCPGTSWTCSVFSTTGFQGVYNQHLLSRELIHNVYLEKIAFTNGYIEFVTNDRIDVRPHITGAPPQKLDQIIIYSDQSPDPVESYQLSNSYFRRNDADTDPLFLRLKLDALIKSSLNLTHTPYKFQYIDIGEIPSKLSKSVDHWGYYNGKDNSTGGWGRATGTTGTLIPSGAIKFLQGGVTVIRGANREAEEEKAKLFLLEEITYPTGGRNKFEYGLNDYANIDLNSDTDFKEEIPQYAFVEACNVTGPAQEAECVALPPQESVEFYIPPTTVQGTEVGQVVNIHATISSFLFDCENDFLPHRMSHGSYARVASINAPGGANQIPTFEFYYPEEEELIDVCVSGVYDHFETKYDVYLEPGWYRVEAFPTAQMEASVRVYGTTVIVNPSDAKVKKGAGLRVNRTVVQTDDGKEIIKRYKYTQKTAQGEELSSGILMSHPKYFLYNHLVEEVTAGVSSCVITCFYDALYVQAMSSSVTPLSTNARGNFVGYSLVEELHGDNAENGKIVYKFYNSPDSDVIPEYARIPNTPTIPFTDNGLADETQHYDNGGFMLRKIKYDYQGNGEIVHKGLNIYAMGIFSSTNGTPVIQWNFYDMPVQWWKLAKVTTTLRDKSSGNAHITELLYEYNEKNKLPERITTKITDSQQGETNFIEELYYPVSFPDESQILGSQLLRDKNIETPVLRKVNYKKAMEIYRQETNYEIQNGNVVPGKVEIFNQGGGDNLSYSYSYDEFENLIDQGQEIGLRTIYIWGYNNYYPIARIDNASYTGMPTDVVNLINQIRTASDVENSDAEEDMIRSLFKILRTNSYFSNSHINSFTYDPLVGMTSQTDPNGITTFYEYDEFNRLKLIRDHEDNIVQHYEYHYHNEAQGGGQ